MATRKKERFVVVTDCHRGVVYGRLIEHDRVAKHVVLADARLVFYWAEAPGGLFSLATEGPREGSKISPPVSRCEVHDVSKVLDCEPGSRKQWEAAGW